MTIKCLNCGSVLYTANETKESIEILPCSRCMDNERYQADFEGYNRGWNVGHEEGYDQGLKAGQ